MKRTVNLQNLSYWLSEIDRIFGIQTILQQPIDNSYITDYYKKSDIGYSFIHSHGGVIHMALNYDGHFDKKGYFEQARIVGKSVTETNARNVLELACGKGVNSIYLSSRNPGVTFTGADLSEDNIKLARKRSKKISQVKFRQGDFHRLPFADASFDAIFEIEGLCHATDMPMALHEIARVLKPGGRFLMFDGFRNARFTQADGKLQTVVKLIETSMAIQKGWIIDDWKELAKKENLFCEMTQDLSSAVMPNMLRFQKMAVTYLSNPILHFLLSKLLSKQLIMNSVAALLMPITLQEKIQGYYYLALRKSA